MFLNEFVNELEMGPGPTRAYFWPAVNKRLTPFDPVTFRPDPKRFFFNPKGKNWTIWRFLGGNFPNSNPNHKWLTRPGSKIFDPDPSLEWMAFGEMSINMSLGIIVDWLQGQGNKSAFV